MQNELVEYFLHVVLCCRHDKEMCAGSCQNVKRELRIQVSSGLFQGIFGKPK